MRRCLLIAVFLLLAAPAAAVPQDRATVTLSSTPDKVPAGEPWKVTLTVKQPGRAPRADLAPSVEVRDADGFTTSHPAVATKRAGRYKATVVFPRAGEWTYAVRDGISAAPPEFRSVVIKDPAPAVDRPEPVGPPELPIIFAGVLVLGAAAFWLARRRRDHPPAHLA
jgi:MYXO-CTERM domain-containing protein